MLQKEVEHTSSAKTDAAAAFLASLEEPKLTSLVEAGKKPPIEIIPPGMPTLSSTISVQKKPIPATQNTQQPPSKPLAIEAPPTTAAAASPSAEASQPSLDDKHPITSTGSGSDLAAPEQSAAVTSTEAASTEPPSQVSGSQEELLASNGEDKQEAPSTQENTGIQETKVPDTLPMSAHLA